MHRRHRISRPAQRVQLVAGLLLTFTAASPALADLIPTCAGSTSCASSVIGGVPIMATSSVLPSYAVARNPDSEPVPPGSPDFSGMTLLALVPNNSANAGSLQPNVSVTLNGTLIASATGFAPVSPTAWTTPRSNLLTDYLAFTQLSGPATKLEDLLPATQAVDAAAKGYFAYMSPIAVITAFGTGQSEVVTYGTFASFTGFPVGTVLFPFDQSVLHGVGPVNTALDSTAPKNAILITSAVPEPASAALLAAGCLLLAGRRRRVAERLGTRVETL